MKGNVPSIETMVADARARTQELLAVVHANPSLEIALRRQLAARGVLGEDIDRFLKGEMGDEELIPLLPAFLDAATPRN